MKLNLIFEHDLKFSMHLLGIEKMKKNVFQFSDYSGLIDITKSNQIMPRYRNVQRSLKTYDTKLCRYIISAIKIALTKSLR